MGIKATVMCGSPTAAQHLSSGPPSPEPARPDTSPTLPPSDSLDSVADQLQGAMRDPLPSPVQLQAAQGSPLSPNRPILPSAPIPIPVVGGEEDRPRPSTPCTRCGHRNLCPTCGLCGRCGREPSPESSPQTSNDDLATPSSGSMVMFTMEEDLGYDPITHEVVVTGHDVPRAARVMQALGRQFIELARGTDLATFEAEPVPNDVWDPLPFPAQSRQAARARRRIFRWPANVMCSNENNNVTFRFGIASRDVAVGSRVGGELARWATNTLGGEWERTIVVMGRAS